MRLMPPFSVGVGALDDPVSAAFLRRAGLAPAASLLLREKVSAPPTDEA
jgi:hypothetical protein